MTKLWSADTKKYFQRGEFPFEKYARRINTFIGAKNSIRIPWIELGSNVGKRMRFPDSTYNTCPARMVI